MHALPTGARARVITFVREARHNHNSLPIIIPGYSNAILFLHSNGFPHFFFKKLVQQLSGPIAGLFTLIFQTVI